MAKTLLNSVNETLKRVSVIAGDSGALSTLTDSARQVSIDVAVQVINEAIGELYSVCEIPQPNELKESTVTLATGTRAYTLASDLLLLRWPFIDRTNNQYLTEFPGGYEKLLLLDPEQDDTGLPHFATIRPTDGKLVVDRAPDAADNGKIYYYQYDKTLRMTLAADTVPFSDDVFDAMVPVWAQIWKRDRRQEYDGAMVRANMGRAARLLTKSQPRTHYSPR